MRNKLILFCGTIGLAFVFSSCSPQTINNNTPEVVLKSFIKDIEKKDFKDAVKLLNPDTVSSRGEIWAQRWIKLNTYGVKNINIEDISVLGGTAHAKVKLVYNDGKTKITGIDLIKNNGTWYISPTFSFEEGR